MTLHERALIAAANFFRAEAELLSILQEMDRCREFRKHGFTSLFAYTVGALKLSESTALNFINVARKSCEVPQLQEAIVAAELSVTKARKIVPVLTLENQEEWIEKAKSLSSRDLEREVARVAPQEPHERIKAIGNDRVQMTVAISEDLICELKRVQDLESQRTKRAVSLEEAMKAAMSVYLERNDPVRKAERARPKLPVPGQVTSEQGRQPFRAQIEHGLARRDQFQCTEIEKGKRCENRRWLEVHHLKPVSEGGTNDIRNLTTLCQAHHQMRHHRVLRT
ncbi:MAG: HNH endonuclease signature motif containing protein [Bdellovibrionota bacterium]